MTRHNPVQMEQAEDSSIHPWQHSNLLFYQLPRLHDDATFHQPKEYNHQPAKHYFQLCHASSRNCKSSMIRSHNHTSPQPARNLYSPLQTGTENFQLYTGLEPLKHIYVGRQLRPLALYCPGSNRLFVSRRSQSTHRNDQNGENRLDKSLDKCHRAHSSHRGLIQRLRQRFPVVVNGVQYD